MESIFIHESSEYVRWLSQRAWRPWVEWLSSVEKLGNTRIGLAFYMAERNIHVISSVISFLSVLLSLMNTILYQSRPKSGLSTYALIVWKWKTL